MLALSVLAGCQASLQRASSPWDEPKPRLVVRPAHKGEKPHLAVAQTVQPPVPNVAPQTARWKVLPPALPGTTLTELPVRPEDRLPWEIPSTASAIVEIARTYLGVPYRFGGKSPEEGFDCSGLVQYVFARQGIGLTRLANEQYLQGTPVAREDLQPGDLVFFSISGRGIDHVGIYAGETRFIHAPRTGRTVSYERLDSAYFSSRFQGARRMAS